MKKEIINILKSLVPKRTTLNILNYARIKDGICTVTDLDCWGFLKTDLPEGIINVAQYATTKNYESAKSEPFEDDEFPQPPQLRQRKKKLDPSIFYDLLDFGDYVSFDLCTRVSLTGVHFTPKHVEATDGHRLLRRYRKCGANFIFPMASLKYFLIKNIFAAGITSASLFEDDNKNQWVALVFDGGEVWFKCVEGPYPDADKVIPKCPVKDRKALDPQLLREHLKVIEPYSPAKTRQVIFGDHEILCHDRDSGKEYELEFPGRLSQNYLGFNSCYFRQLLRLTGEKAKYHSPHQLGGFIIWSKYRGENQIQILMPIRILEDEDINENYEKAIKLEYVPAPANGKKRKSLPAAKILEYIRSHQKQSGAEILKALSAAGKA